VALRTLPETARSPPALAYGEGFPLTWIRTVPFSAAGKTLREALLEERKRYPLAYARAMSREAPGRQRGRDEPERMDVGLRRLLVRRQSLRLVSVDVPMPGTPTTVVATRSTTAKFARFRNRSGMRRRCRPGTPDPERWNAAIA
jgi:hypothetical protein